MTKKFDHPTQFANAIFNARRLKYKCKISLSDKTITISDRDKSAAQKMLILSK